MTSSSSVSSKPADSYQTTRDSLSDFSKFTVRKVSDDHYKYSQTVDISGKKVVITVDVPFKDYKALGDHLDAKVVQIALRAHATWEASYHEGLTKVLLEGKDAKQVFCFDKAKLVEKFDLGQKIRSWDENDEKEIDDFYFMKNRAFEYLKTDLPQDQEQKKKSTKNGLISRMRNVFSKKERSEPKAEAHLASEDNSRSSSSSSSRSSSSSSSIGEDERSAAEEE